MGGRQPDPEEVESQTAASAGGREGPVWMEGAQEAA